MRGEDDDDTLIGGQGDDELAGGEGLDWISGGAGNDTIRGGAGNDVIHPGMGRDDSRGGEGDDTFTVHGECEIEPGEVIDGGAGEDKLVSSLTEQELIERGVKLVSIENFVQRYRGLTKQDEAIGSDAICRLQDPELQSIEVSGTVTDEEVLWKDEEGTLREQDGTLHGSWDIVTRYHLQIDTVYLGAVQAGETIPILIPGGSIDAADGTGLSGSGCCYTSIHSGRRYRLELREARAHDGTQIGWEYEWLLEAVVNHALVLPLGAHGPISFAAMNLPEGYGPPCPEVPRPAAFASNRKAIEWARSLGYRWDQSEDICGGGDPCMIAAPRASMDRNMTTPDDCEDVETFRSTFSDAARIISNGGLVSGMWGVHPPGVATNPAPLGACDTSENDDDISCIAVSEPRPTSAVHLGSTSLAASMDIPRDAPRRAPSRCPGPRFVRSSKSTSRSITTSHTATCAACTPAGSPSPSLRRMSWVMRSVWLMSRTNVAPTCWSRRLHGGEPTRRLGFACSIRRTSSSSPTTSTVSNDEAAATRRSIVGGVDLLPAVGLPGGAVPTPADRHHRGAGRHRGRWSGRYRWSGSVGS